MVDAEDYEALPESTPFHIVAAAGAAAGVAEHCVMYPVDSVKVCCFQKFKIDTLNLAKDLVNDTQLMCGAIFIMALKRGQIFLLDLFLHRLEK